MTAHEPTPPPERVEELTEALADVAHHWDSEAPGTVWQAQAQALARLIAGWLAEAYSRGVNDTFDTDGALMKAREQGAADVRARVDAALRLVSPDHITPMGARQIRAVLATEREERR